MTPMLDKIEEAANQYLRQTARNAAFLVLSRESFDAYGRELLIRDMTPWYGGPDFDTYRSCAGPLSVVVAPLDGADGVVTSSVVILPSTRWMVRRR